MTYASKTYTSNPKGFLNKLSLATQKELFTVSQHVHLDYKKEQVFFFGNGQILILETGFLMTIRYNKHGKHIGIDILRPGDLLGICQLFNPNYRNTISVLPLSAINGYLLSVTDMECLIKKNEELLMALITQFSERFIRVVNNFNHIAIGTSTQKLQYILTTITNLNLEYPTHEELAILSGLNRVTVTKQLNLALSRE